MYHIILPGLALFIGGAHAILDNLPAFNNNNHTFYTKNLANNAVSPTRTLAKWPWGRVPYECMENSFILNECTPETIDIYNITYGDCQVPWIVCRCNTVPATYSIDIIAKQIGQVPVRTRQWVRQFMFFPNLNGGGGPGGAGSNGADIAVKGPYPADTVLWHETGHNLDFWVAGKGISSWSDNGGQLVNGRTFQQALMADTCVATDYSHASWAEAFAELTIQASYKLNIGPIPIPHSCFANGLAIVKAIAGSAITYNSALRCDNRIVPTTTVCMSTAARNAGLCAGVPSYEEIDILSKRDVEERTPLPIHDGIIFHRTPDNLPRHFTMGTRKRLVVELEKLEEKRHAQTFTA